VRDGVVDLGIVCEDVLAREVATLDKYYGEGRADSSAVSAEFVVMYP